MKTYKGKILRIYLEENDKYDKKALYEWLLDRAIELNIAGATVIRGMEGFGAKKHFHTVHILSISLNLPVIIEIVDSKEKIEAFIEQVKEPLKGCLTTIQDIEISLNK
jgi:PII-like signaling protein